MTEFKLVSLDELDAMSDEELRKIEAESDITYLRNQKQKLEKQYLDLLQNYQSQLKNCPKVIRAYEKKTKKILETIDKLLSDYSVSTVIENDYAGLDELFVLIDGDRDTFDDLDKILDEILSLK